MPTDQGIHHCIWLAQIWICIDYQEGNSGLACRETKQNRTLCFSSSLSLFQVTYRHVIKTRPIKSLLILLIQRHQVTNHNLKPEAQLEYIHPSCHILAFLRWEQTAHHTGTVILQGLPDYVQIFIFHILLRKLVPSGKGAINKSKGKPAKQRLFSPSFPGSEALIFVSAK